VLGPLTPRHLGIVMTAFAEGAVFLALLRRATPDRLYLGLAAATLAAFCLMTSMHERYAFAALVFLAPLLAHRPIQVTWGILAVAISLNVAAGAPPDTIGPIVPIGGLVGTAGSVAMVVATGVALVALVRRGPSVGGRDAPGAPPGTSGGSGAATS